MKNSIWALFFALALISGNAIAAEEGVGAIVEDRMSTNPTSPSSSSSDHPMWLTEEEDALRPAAPSIPDTPAAKMDYLQQQVQDLRGKLELQDHRIQELSKQLTDNFQDLDLRLKNLTALQATKSESTATEASSTPVPAPIAVAPVPVPAQAVSAEDDKTIYQQAYSLAQEKKYDQSIESFKRLIQTYPKSTYVPTAYFWMGEIYVIQSKYDEATESFNQIISHYPDSPKVSEALFKTGYIAYARGNNKLAIKKFNEVKSRYPGTIAAKQADQYLKKLKAKKA